MTSVIIGKVGIYHPPQLLGICAYNLYVGTGTSVTVYVPAYLPVGFMLRADAAITLVVLGRGLLDEYPPAWIPTSNPAVGI